MRRDLGRPADEDLETTIALLDLLNDVDKEQRTIADLRHRLSQMEEELVAFRTDAVDLARRIAPDLADAEAFVVRDVLRQRLTHQRSLTERKSTLAEQLQKAEATLARQRNRHARCSDDLTALLRLIGAETADAAEERIAVAEERARQKALLGEAAAELRKTGDGIGLEQLRTEIANVSINEVAARIAEHASDRDEAFKSAQELAGRIATMPTEMEREANSTEAQKAAADQKAALAAIDEVLDRGALMHLASLLLQSSLEEVDAAGTSVLLTRIGSPFSTLTDGAYLRVEADDPGDGSARLLAVDRTEDESRTVGGHARPAIPGASDGGH